VDASAILDTRKTTPGLRTLEKYAVRAGGATNHRAGLFDAILIKENHIHLAGGVERAIELCRAHSPGLPIEIEAETLDEVDQALAAGAEVILVDNMSTADIRRAVGRARGRAKVEISGGVTLERVPELAATGADYVSAGALTHSAPAVDISFEITRLRTRSRPCDRPGRWPRRSSTTRRLHRPTARGGGVWRRGDCHRRRRADCRPRAAGTRGSRRRAAPPCQRS
jgi:hypothetical protein